MTELKRKYGEGTSCKEFCPNCGREFHCLPQGVFENGGAIMVYSSDMVFCDECDKYDVQQSLNTIKYNKTVPDNYKV